MGLAGWGSTFAMYSASLLRQGNFVDAGFVSAVLFERIIEDAMAKHSLQKSSNGDFLYNAIEQLSRVDSSRYGKRHLHRLRKIRNRYVIHTDDAFEGYTSPQERERIKREIALLVEFVWKEMDPENQGRYETIKKIPMLTADYAVLAVREFFQDETIEVEANHCTIEERDFHDLLHMRKHLLHLADHINRTVLASYPNLEIDIISRVDTTSAYVWLAANLHRNCPDHQRDRIRNASASIIVTPLDIRICISLGSEGYMPRRDWYRFIESPVFMDLVDRTPELQVFGVDWYSFIVNRYDARMFIGSPAFRDALADARSQLDACQNSRAVITWERLQVGYIIERTTLPYSELCNRFETILRLYYQFEAYRRDVLKRKNYLDWIPEGV